MSSRYPGRPETSNKTRLVGVRLNDYQYGRIQKTSQEFKMTISDIIREAVAVWLNMNNKGVD